MGVQWNPEFGGGCLVTKHESIEGSKSGIYKGGGYANRAQMQTAVGTASTISSHTPHVRVLRIILAQRAASRCETPLHARHGNPGFGPPENSGVRSARDKHRGSRAPQVGNVLCRFTRSKANATSTMPCILHVAIDRKCSDTWAGAPPRTPATSAAVLYKLGPSQPVNMRLPLNHLAHRPIGLAHHSMHPTLVTNTNQRPWGLPLWVPQRLRLSLQVQPQRVAPPKPCLDLLWGACHHQTTADYEAHAVY